MLVNVEKTMKRATLKGKLIVPLELGKPAYIQVPQGIMRTSAVQHFIEDSNSTEIVTQNSVYVLEKEVK